MADFEQNPRAVIGGNQTAFDDAVATFDFVGFLLARHETLARAALDDALDRPCVKVLCVLIGTMNRETRTSWAGREYIAQQLGMSAKTVSNYIYQLKCLGYLVSERRATPQANDRVLMHYTLSKLKPAEIEAAIERAISSIKGERNPVVQFPSPREVRPESSRQDRNSVPVGTGTIQNSSSQDGKSKTDVPAPTGTQIDTVPVTAGTEAESSRQDGHSNNNSSFLLTTKNRTSGERGAGRDRGTRIPDDWALTSELGRWVTDRYNVRPSMVRAEAVKFSNYWRAKPGKEARKVDWTLTWHNWAMRAFEKFLKPDANDRNAPNPGAASNKAIIEANEAIAAAEGWFTPNAEIVRE